jgi:hypothetical protein
MFSIDIDEKIVIKDFAEMLADTNIHGHINSRYKEQRKPVVSKIGIEVATKLAQGLVGYLSAYAKN